MNGFLTEAVRSGSESISESRRYKAESDSDPESRANAWDTFRKYQLMGTVRLLISDIGGLVAIHHAADQYDQDNTAD